MFHFSELKLVKNGDLGFQKRLDICSGFFKHLPQYIIDEANCIFVNSKNQILLVKNSENSWTLPGGKVDEEISPKLAITKSLSKFEIDLPTKKLEQFCYVKTNQIVEGQLDNSGNPVWDIESVQVIFLCILEESESSLSEKLDDKFKTKTKKNGGKKLNQNRNYQWVEIGKIKTELKEIYGLESLVDLVIQLLGENVRVDL